MAEPLAVWLSAQLDEDEAAAKAATPGPWVAVENYPDAWIVEATADNVVSETNSGCIPVGDALHIAAWDPARVLAEVAAKRRIIDHVMSWQHDDPDGGGYYSCPLVPDSSRAEDEDWDGTSCWCGLVARQMAFLRPLALPYAGRDGYQEAWRPK